MNDIKQKIKDLIGKGDLKNALKEFRSHVSIDSDLEYHLIQIDSKLSTLEEQKHQNVISDGDEKKEIAKIGASILYFLKSWEEHNIQSQLEKAIEKLSIEKDPKLGVLQLVNCNRSTALKKINRAFRDKTENKQKAQFYFICGCPNEMPSSFAERIVYEIIEKQSDSTRKSVHFYRNEEDFKRIEIEPLPLGLDVESSKKKCRDFFQKYLKFSGSENFEELIQNGVSGIRYKYIPLIFHISETKWKGDEGEIREYLEWLVAKFSGLPPEAPTYVFFLIVGMKGFHLRPQTVQEKIFQELKNFCEKHNTMLLSDLKPVEDRDIETWFEDEIGIQNPNDYRKVIEIHYDNLPLQDRLLIDEQKYLSMKDVELLQHKVISFLRNKK